MADDLAIRVENVSKDFVLPHEKVTSIKSAFTSLLRGRSKTKETQHALRNVNFDIKKGEFFGIVGRNGSGKSTMLKILAGIYQPSVGKVTVNGKLVPFIELGVGFNPELTGRENVYLNGAMLGFSEKEVEAMYDDIVAFAELERFMDQKLKNYSSGMQVRLAFSMATRSEADILLIDEVLAVGDADFQRKCYEYFKSLKKNKKTVVFVSHDMSAVREYCDRALLLDKSEIQIIGKPDVIAEHYTQLFTENEIVTDEKTKIDDSRWGNNAAETIGVNIQVTKTSIGITHRFKSNAADTYIVPGFRIRDAAGVEVLGTNSRIEKMIVQLKKDSTIRVNWSFPNILSDGKYIVDTAILSENESTVLEWYDDAYTFKIKKERHLPYSIDPGYTFAIES